MKKVPQSLVDWARQQVKQHPLSKDSHPVIPDVTKGGEVVSPAVTLGQLRRWLKSAELSDDEKLDDVRDKLAHSVAAMKAWPDQLVLVGAETLASAALGRVESVIKSRRKS